MKSIKLFVFMLIVIVGVFLALTNAAELPKLKGPFLGQKLPATVVGIFAPGTISTGLEETVITFMPDGKECYWSILLSGFETILTSRMESDGWTEPQVASFAGKYYDGWPIIQPDGMRMFFHSSRPLPNGVCVKPSTFNIWVVEKTGDGWSEPRVVGEPVNGGGNATCPSITTDGTIYFSKKFSDNSEKICRSRLVNGIFQKLEVLPAMINTSTENFHAVISPDESYLIRPLCNKADAIGGNWNYYVSFRNHDDQWSELLNLGEGVNSAKCGAVPSISGDGKCLFFQLWTPPVQTLALERKFTFRELLEKENKYPSSYSMDIYWISAQIIEKLRQKK